MSMSYAQIEGKHYKNNPKTLDAAVRTAVANTPRVTQQALIDAIERIKSARIQKSDVTTQTIISASDKEHIQKRLRAHLNT